MVRDVSASMNVGMYELAILATVKILDLIGFSLAKLNVIPFSERAALKQLTFGRNGNTNSKEVYERLSAAVNGLGVVSGKTNIIPAVNLLSGCKNSNFIVFFSRFDFNDECGEE